MRARAGPSGGMATRAVPVQQSLAALERGRILSSSGRSRKHDNCYKRYQFHQRLPGNITKK